MLREEDDWSFGSLNQYDDRDALGLYIHDLLQWVVVVSIANSELKSCQLDGILDGAFVVATQ